MTAEGVWLAALVVGSEESLAHTVDAEDMRELNERAGGPSLVIGQLNGRRVCISH